MRNKLKDAQSFFVKNNKIAVAFSGGVDSSVLLCLAKSFGAQTAAYYVKSEFQPRFELEDAEKTCDALGIELNVIELSVLEEENISSNPENRCYYCKKKILKAVTGAAQRDGYTVVADGTNASDDVADRPGFAALRELGVLSPLRLCGFDKSDIRLLAAQYNLAVADKPSYACLATRVPHGCEITRELLEKTEAAESEMSALGFSDFRIKYRDGAALIQVNHRQLRLLGEKKEEVLSICRKYYSGAFLYLKTRG